ncbi:hypothetical protein CAPTEDRAFT_210042 [Capitella teleta]|uniref:Integrase zinc-binding domain-containing protein n=1 Tax=Capitella teleta TaxID=283909 RepID=R7UXY6_CAPTE|nr:hypothetical protein CAPTEDRAFT_210042 [Capitella teleta]|eukprot:ELU11137.1 hypothetical protein CAPTEDRAFT_210042 [Capitella teleta]
MLSRIAAIEPPTPTPVIVPADIPDVWVTDRIDLQDLARHQKEQFHDAYVEASQETDESPYIVQGSLLYTMAEPSHNAGRYLRLLLPQQFRQKVIDRCHAEVGHAAFLKTLSRVQEHYVWPAVGLYLAILGDRYITLCPVGVIDACPNIWLTSSRSLETTLVGLALIHLTVLSMKPLERVCKRMLFICSSSSISFLSSSLRSFELSKEPDSMDTIDERRVRSNSWELWDENLAFITSACIYVTGGLVFVLLSSAEVQPWARKPDDQVQPPVKVTENLQGHVNAACDAAITEL